MELCFLAGRSAGSVPALNSIKDFPPVDRNFLWSLNSKTHFIATNLHDNDGDVVVNNNAFVLFSRKDKHKKFKSEASRPKNQTRVQKNGFETDEKPYEPTLRSILSKSNWGEKRKKCIFQLQYPFTVRREPRSSSVLKSTERPS